MKLTNMKDEELELLSYTEIAKMYIEEVNKTMNTADLFKEVCKLLKMSDAEYQDKIADFFQSLTTSKDFILLNDGNWDLKKHHKVKIDMDELYDDKDEEVEEEPTDEEITEEDEYNSIDDESEYAEEDLGDLTILTEEELEDSE